MEDYLRADDDDAKKSVGARLRNSIASLSSSGRRATANAAESLNDRENGYTDLQGEAAAKSRLDALEAAIENETTYARAARMLRGEKKREPAASRPEEPSPPATAPLGDTYIQMDDGDTLIKSHSSLVLAASNAASGSILLSKAVSSALTMFKPKVGTEERDGCSRLAAKPYIAEFAPPLSYHETTPSAPSLPAFEDASGHPCGSGGLWSLKAKLVAVEKERVQAQTAYDDARNHARDRRETLQEATNRCSRLERRELFLRELLRHAAEAENESQHTRK